MSRYINPFTDFGFKKLFGTEINKDLLIDFLNSLLSEEASIRTLRYLPTEQWGDGAFERKAIFDVYCENERGEKFIVEMQKAEQDYFKDRSIFYSTFPIREQAKRGNDWDFELKAVYTIGLLDFTFDNSPLNDEVVHHEVVLYDKNTQRQFYDKLTYIYLELPKFHKTEEELDTNFDKWLYLLCHMEVLDRCPARLQSKIFEKAFATAEIAKYNPAEQRSYEDSLKVYRDLLNVVRTAERKGKAEGRAEGKAEGIAEGKAEGKAEVAKSMKDKGMASDLITQLTGLTEEEISLL